MKKINLGNISISLEDFAIQGNGILGIKETGKSSTAIYLAEQLLENKIPFIAFDQIGIWKNMKIPGRGRGYEVVVAGGKDGDLPLTVQSAPEIIRAAMKNNIPLVMDLYDMKLSKTDRKRIVEVSVEILTYENGEYGPRHIFFEEAAQVVPQRIDNSTAKVYGAIEQLAFMGGNALLGYTLIGLRPEEINKAVLELCDCLLLFRQRGKNSLTALDKWLKIADVDTETQISKSLATLGPGECWVWARESARPVRTIIPQKNSFHPDRRKPLLQVKASKKIVDVSGFVTRLSDSLSKQLVEAKENDPKALKLRISQLERELSKNTVQPKAQTEYVDKYIPLAKDLKTIEAANKQTEKLLGSLQSEIERYKQAQANMMELYRNLSPSGKTLPEAKIIQSPKPKQQQGFEKVIPVKWEGFSNDKLPEGELEVLNICGQFADDGADKDILMLMTGKKISTVNAYVDRLKKKGLVFQVDKRSNIFISQEGIDFLGPDIKILPTGPDLYQYWIDNLPEGERAILSISYNNRRNMQRADFDPYIARLAEEGTIQKPYAESTRNAYIDRLIKRRLLIPNGRAGVSPSDKLY